jgi:hypothetical protein
MEIKYISAKIDNWFVKFPKMYVFKNITFELAESLANKEKAGFLLPAVSIGDA